MLFRSLRMNDGPIPFWVFDPARRVPGTGVLDYLPLARLLWAPAGKSVGEVITCKGTLYERLVEPLLLAALNIDAPDGSARLAGAIVRETLAVGGRACRPLIAREGLGSTLIEPALAFLQGRRAEVRMEHQLRALRLGAGRVEALDFGAETISLGADDAVILAVPPYIASSLLRDLTVPTEFRAIVNAHFRVAPPVAQPPIMGVLNATTQWLFAFPGRLSKASTIAGRHYTSCAVPSPTPSCSMPTATCCSPPKCSIKRLSWSNAVVSAHRHTSMSTCSRARKRCS